MNKELKAEGAINGGFFTKGKPIGTLLINGIPLFPSYGRRSAVGWTARVKLSSEVASFEPYYEKMTVLRLSAL